MVSPLPGVSSSSHPRLEKDVNPQTEAPNELPVYNWHPEVLAKANASSEYLSFLLRARIASFPSESQESLIAWINKELVTARLGITNALETELNALASNPFGATTTFALMVSVRARVGWSTHGHSAVDVNIYSSGGAAAEKIRGNVENTDVGKFLSEYLEVDVEAITKELQAKMASSGPVEVLGGRVDEFETGGHPAEWLTNVGL